MSKDRFDQFFDNAFAACERAVNKLSRSLDYVLDGGGDKEEVTPGTVTSERETVVKKDGVVVERVRVVQTVTTTVHRSKQ